MNIGQLLTSKQDALTRIVEEARNGEHDEPGDINYHVALIKAIKMWLEVIPRPESSIEEFCDEAIIWGLEQNALTGEHDTEAQKELTVYLDAINLITHDCYPY